MIAIAQALPPFPGETIEPVELDVGISDGETVIIGGRVSIWEGTSTMFVDVSSCPAGIDRFTASTMLQHAVRDRLIGSDVVRSAVERGFEIRGLTTGGDR